MSVSCSSKSWPEYHFVRHHSLNLDSRGLSHSHLDSSCRSHLQEVVPILTSFSLLTLPLCIVSFYDGHTPLFSPLYLQISSHISSPSQPPSSAVRSFPHNQLAHNLLHTIAAADPWPTPNSSQSTAGRPHRR